MMNRTKLLYARAGATAIAAALALSSTSVLAQDAQPVQPAPTDAIPVATPSPAPTSDSQAGPASADSATTTTEPTDAATTATPIQKTTKASRSTTLKRTVAAAPAKPSPMKSTASKAVTTSVASKPAPAPVTTAAVTTTEQTSQSKVKPIIDVNNAPVPATPAKATKKKNDTPVIAAGSALAFLAIGGAAVGLSRRKREDEEMMDGETMVDDPAPEAEPTVRDPIFDQEPAMIAPDVSAFSWRDQSGAERGSENNGETWVERAYRGPSPENPSLSLRKRLKRAAFFDKRDREVAAGEADRVESAAGLPDALAGDHGLELA
jgi:hypothetical protein